MVRKAVISIKITSCHLSILCRNFSTIYKNEGGDFVENISKKIGGEPLKQQAVLESLFDNLEYIEQSFGKSYDLKIRRASVSQTELAVVSLDGMCDQQELLLSLMQPLLSLEQRLKSGEDLMRQCMKGLSRSADQRATESLTDAIAAIISGCAVLFIDKAKSCLILSVQGYPTKGISEPMTDVQEKGSHEGFTDNFKENTTLIRRRLASEKLRLIKFTLGEESRTAVILCYLQDRADRAMIKRVEEKLKSIRLDCVSAAGNLQSFFEPKGHFFFSAVGVTERPDTFCAKLCEGRIGIICDGAPQALLLPYLFIEYFQSLDDYLRRPFYSLFLRIIKLLSFVAGVFIPGVYVAVGSFHPELFPADIVFWLASSEQQTPFTLVTEAFIIHLIYEVVREAGLRMPKAMGHAVSIVGALIIGDAAVTAGLIAAPMLIIVALSAIASAVMAPLHDVISTMRLCFILIGGALGLYGIIIGAAIIFINMCAQEPFSVPFTAPVTPFYAQAARDTLFRQSWQRLGRKSFLIGKIKENRGDKKA